MGKLHDRQALFTSMVPGLIEKAEALGFVPVIDYARRCNDCPVNTPGLGARSLHTSRLAIDLLLFRDGEYLRAAYHYDELGEYWESQGGAWGGRFTHKDANHFSLEYQGRR